MAAKQKAAKLAQGASSANEFQKVSNEELIRSHRGSGNKKLEATLDRFEACLDMLAHPQHHYKKDVEIFLGGKTAEPQQVDSAENQGEVHLNKD